MYIIEKVHSRGKFYNLNIALQKKNANNIPLILAAT